MKSLILSASVLLAGATFAAVSYMPVGSVTNDGETVRVVTPAGTVVVSPITPDIFQVSRIPNGDDISFRDSYAKVLKYDFDSVSVAAAPDWVTLTSPSTTVRINRQTGLVDFLDKDGKLIIAEADGVVNSPVKSNTASFVTPAGENFYGAGERGHSLRLNGDTLTMYNRQNYGYVDGEKRISQMGISVPYFVSDAGYGILFDDHDRSQLILGKDTISYNSPSPDYLSYCFINGHTGSLAGATTRFTELTGRQSLPPFWSLGYITSKYGYGNRAETEGVVDTLKSRGYPLDGLILDLYWYGVETDMGRLQWDEKKWPDHAGMLRGLKEKGVNVIPISQPYINKKGAIDNYNYLSSRGMLAKDAKGKTHDVTTWVGDAGMFDVSNPDTRKWLWNRLRGLTAEGLAGWWGDLGEPEVHPETIRHANGMTAEQYHNIYGNEWSRLIYEGLRNDFPEMRPILMMRGGSTGLQRYSVFPWTTDVSRSWGGFAPQVKFMLSSGLSGLGYMGSDVGGFAVDPANPTDSELYARWIQAGAFSPMLRTHAQQKPEPYNYPDVEDIARKYILMRYEWLPYNYTLAYENASKGYPLARPLNFDMKDSPSKFANVEDEYLWGSEILVAPVFKKGARSRKVLFPAGNIWYDWWNPALKYSGGKTATVNAPLPKLPLFVKAGSFVPQYMEKIGNVTEYNPQFLTVKYFPAKEWTSYTLFDDDRKSPTSLDDGDYLLTKFSGSRQGKEIYLKISTEGRRFEGCPEFRMLTMEIMDVAATPKSVELSNHIPMPRENSVKAIRQSGWNYDASRHVLTLRFPYEYNSVEITVR